MWVGVRRGREHGRGEVRVGDHPFDAGCFEERATAVAALGGRNGPVKLGRVVFYLSFHQIVVLKAIRQVA